MTQTTSLRPDFVRFIRREDEWALFSLKIEQNDQGQPWVFVSGLPELRPDGLIPLFREWKRLERWCYHDGILGWYCVTDTTNTRFVRWLLAIGATPSITIPGRGQLFVKKVLQDPAASWSMFDIKDLATFIHHGRAGHA